MNDVNEASRSWQFSLLSLFAATVSVALALFACRLFGFLRVALFAAYVGIVAGNLAIAVSGAKFGRPVLAGVLGGATLWSIVPVCGLMLTTRVLRFHGSLMFCLIGVVAGLVCGGYARLKHRPVDGQQHKGMAYCVILFAAFAAVFCLERFLASNPAWRSLLGSPLREGW